MRVIEKSLVLGNAMHITAAVFINGDESRLHADYKKWPERLAPFDASPRQCQSNRTGEDNTDAQKKRQVMRRVAVITEGKPDFGP